MAEGSVHGEDDISGFCDPRKSELLYLRRIEWILLYHTALCQYMMSNFPVAEEVNLHYIRYIVLYSTSDFYFHFIENRSLSAR